MKAVLVGADLMYRKDGSLAPIEINTNTGWDNVNRVELLEDVFDLADLVEFIEDYGFKKVYLEGIVTKIADLLQQSLKSTEVVSVSREEMEALEDFDDILTIRSYYSDEALVDSFCRDKIAFLKSISDKSIGCEYLLKTDGELEGEITQVETEYPAGVPNFILKYRYPNYDKTTYPKLLRFESIQELMDYAEEEMEDDYFLMPFYYNEDELLYDGTRIPLIRELNLFVANDGNLESIEIGKYTKVCDHLKLDKVVYENNELDPDYRNMFLSSTWFTMPTSTEQALLEEGDLVWMSDGSWKAVEELEEGDEVKSLEIPAKEGFNTETHTGNYGVTVEELETETNYIDNTVTAIRKVNRFEEFVAFEFTDSTFWEDTIFSSYPTVTVDGIVEFKTLGDINSGDNLILISLENTESPEFLVKEVAFVKKERRLTEGYGIELDGSHLFVSRPQGAEQAYASIEHNLNPSEISCTPGGSNGSCGDPDAIKTNNNLNTSGTGPASLTSHTITWNVTGGSISFANVSIKGYACGKSTVQNPSYGCGTTSWYFGAWNQNAGTSFTKSNMQYTMNCGGQRYDSAPIWRQAPYLTLEWGSMYADGEIQVTAQLSRDADCSMTAGTTETFTITFDEMTGGSHQFAAGKSIISLTFAVQ